MMQGVILCNFDCEDACAMKLLASLPSFLDSCCGTYVHGLYSLSDLELLKDLEIDRTAAITASSCLHRQIKVKMLLTSSILSLRM